MFIINIDMSNLIDCLWIIQINNGIFAWIKYLICCWVILLIPRDWPFEGIDYKTD